MKRIESLTTEQLDLIAVVRDEWLAHGLSTERADRAEAVRGVNNAYREAGLKPPHVVLWLDSPLAGTIGSTMLGQVGGQVRGQVGGQVGGQVSQVRGQVWDQVWDQVGDQVGDQVRGQVRGQVGDQVRGQVRGQVGDQVWDQVRGQVRGQVERAILGQHEAGWLSFYDYFRRACALDACVRLDGIMRVAQSSGWWWAQSGAVVLTERPTHLYRDAQTRLHHETGPALLYPDGFGIWAWHGTRVPKDLIDGRWSTQDILRHDNAEVRRCAIEKMGWDRFIVDAGLRQIGDTTADPGNPGHFLALYDVPERIYDQPIRVLLCDNATPERDGTRRRFGLTVPATVPDPIAAASWTFGLNPSDYAQLVHAY